MKPIFLALATPLLFSHYSTLCFATDTMPEALYTKSARTYSSYVFDVYAEFYKDRQLEEIDNLDATELRAELSFPVFTNGQLRLSLPFYTDGEGTRVLDGIKTDLNGNGGTFNFASIAYEHQMMDSASDSIDLMAYASFGYRTNKLKTSFNDYMNHRGHNFKAGMRMSTDINSSILFLSDVGYQYYRDTDDLNPSDNESNFGYLVTSVAIIKHNTQFKPALELIYRGDVSHYNNLSLVPELIYSFDSSDIKLGFPVGLTDDADNYGVTLGLNYRM